MLAFRKVEGLGNDFVLLDRLDVDADTLARAAAWASAEAPKLCDRRTGIGADGILLVGPGRRGAASMIVINFDGSRPEMCGNGLRCVAAFVAERRGLDTLSIDTDAGVRACRILGVNAGVASVSVDMGPAERLGNHRPAAGKGREFVGISMGNPHAVHFLDHVDHADHAVRIPSCSPARSGRRSKRIRSTRPQRPTSSLRASRPTGASRCGCGNAASASPRRVEPARVRRWLQPSIWACATRIVRARCGCPVVSCRSPCPASGPSRSS